MDTQQKYQGRDQNVSGEYNPSTITDLVLVQIGVLGPLTHEFLREQVKTYFPNSTEKELVDSMGFVVDNGLATRAISSEEGCAPIIAYRPTEELTCHMNKILSKLEN